MGDQLDASPARSAVASSALLLEALPRAIVVVDLDGRIVAWNHVSERLYGWTAAEAMGRSLYELITPEPLRAAGKEIMQHVLQGNEWWGRVKVVDRDGVEKATTSFLGPFRDADGAIVGALAAADDATELVQLEHEASELAGRLQVALTAAEQSAELERLQRERLEFLANLNDVALSATDHRSLMRLAAQAAVPRLGDWCALHFIPEPGTHEVQVAHHDPAKVQWANEMQRRYPFDPRNESGPAAVIRTGVTEFVRTLDPRIVENIVSTAADPGELRSIIDTLQLTSIITVPITTKRGTVGAMQFVSAESQRTYDDSDVALAESAAGRIAEALDNAWLTEQQRDIARTLQAALLPAQLPEIAGVDLAVRYWAAGAVAEVGGDFYDAFSIGDQRWALVIGDVCGTGADAAAVTAVARHTIRAAATHGATHVQVLNWVNTAILNGSSSRFCTLLYATLEPLGNGTWRFTSITGGHPLPVHVAPDHDTAMIGRHGTLIGVLDRIDVTPVETILAPGSTLVMHTDGVNDIRPPHAMDDAALAAMVETAAAAGGTADDVAERLGAAIEAVLPIPDRNDDVAIVVLRIR